MSSGISTDLWPELLKDSLRNFHTAVLGLRRGLDIKCACKIFTPTEECSDDIVVPEKAWCDKVDTFLEKLIKKGFSNVLEGKWNDAPLKPIAGAIARYEPVLSKVPHYFFPASSTWNEDLMEKNTCTIQTHFLNLQENALKEKFFEKVPKSDPHASDGLIPLLEYLALYPAEASEWAKKHEDISVKEGALIINNLKKCQFVSEEGKRSYKNNHGCLFFPFVAHDNRLVGHGIIVLDREISQSESHCVNALVEFWNILFEATISPIIANLNSAILSTLDGFFLGRVRSLRRIIGGQGENIDSYGIPNKDLLILNKIATYELIESKLLASNSNREERFYLVFFDLDNFKSVNDTIGHQKADVLLFKIAENLTSLFSPKNGEWLGRFGGDEFVGIIQKDVNIKDFSQKIAAAISKTQVEYKNLYDNIKKRENNRNQINFNLSTSMGWIFSDDAEEEKLKNSACGLSEHRKNILIDMPTSIRLIELADTDVQTHVKRFGKNGYLQFDRCWDLPSDKEQICTIEGLDTIRRCVRDKIQWFHSENPERSFSIEVKHSPP